MQVVAWQGEGEFAWVERAGRRELVNMMLLGSRPIGTWVLTSLGLAREVVEDEQLAQIEEALAALDAVLAANYDPALYFRDIKSR